MKKLFQLLILLPFCNAAPAAAQGAWIPSGKTEIISAYSKATDWFIKTKNYQLSVHYASYVDYTTQVAYDQSEASYLRYGNNISNKAFGVTTIQNSDLRFAVDSTNQVILLNNASPVNRSPADLQPFSDLLDHVQAMKKLLLPDGSTLYRIEFRPNELYSASEFVVNEKGQLSKLSYYYSKAVSEEDEQGDEAAHKDIVKTTPRMEILFYGYKEPGHVDQQLFSEKKYFRTDKNRIIPADRYKNYTVKDYRLSAN